MLWKKELINRKSVYVNIFFGSEFYTMCNDFYTDLLFGADEKPTKKYSEFSDYSLRRASNMMHDEKDPEQILQQIIHALCEANINSVQSGLAYGLRAECFYKLKQYSLSLVDIELAEKNKYPLEKWPELETLKNNCLKMLEIVDRNKTPLADEPKLSFPVDAKIPCFAQGLEVKNSKKFGKHIVTNRKLEIGQTVIVEEAFCIRAENSQNRSQCANCFKRKANLIPCKKCSSIMFCSQNCYDVGYERFHAFECEKQGVHDHWEAARRIVMQTVIEAIKMFPSVKELMDVIEKFINRKPNSEFNYADPSIRAYMQFFALSSSEDLTPSMQDLQFVGYTKTIHSLIATHSLWKAEFQSLETTRFLAHLILHHFYILDANGFDAVSYLHGTYTTELGTDMENGSGFTYAHGIYLNSSQLNHSCQPNIARIFIGTKLIGKVIRPINRGEQLFVSYL